MRSKTYMDARTGRTSGTSGGGTATNFLRPRHAPWRAWLVVTVFGFVAAGVGACDDDDEKVYTNSNYSSVATEETDAPEDTRPDFMTGPAAGYGYPGADGVEVEASAPETLSQSLALPTGEPSTSTLLIERTGPGKIQVGQPYSYQIKVTNLTQQPIAGVRVREEHAGGAFTVEQANPAAQTDPKSDPAAQSPSAGQSQSAAMTWHLGVLGPNETRVIQVTGIPEQTGRIASTIDAEYSQSLSAEAEVKHGEVTLTKEGPPKADLCEPFAYRYVVTNGGQGDTGTLTLSDQFPPGLVTEDGKGSVTFELGSLPKGQTRDFSVRMKPQQPGEYASRAVAKGAFGEARSRRVATVVTAPKLVVELNGPQWEQITRPITYEVTVRNDGDATARDVSLKVDAGGGARVLSGQDLANALVAAAQPPAPAQPGKPAPNPGEQVLQIGSIEPGKSHTVALTIKVPQPGNVSLSVAASSTCGQQPVSATAQSLVVGVPALSLDVVDAADPVQVGQVLDYRVTLTNAGSAADGGIVVVATVPDGTSFVEGSGMTGVKAEGGKITFATVPALGPTQTAQWQVKLKADRPGEKRLRVEARSAGLNGMLTQTEQTRVEEPPPPPPAPAQ